MGHWTNSWSLAGPEACMIRASTHVLRRRDHFSDQRSGRIYHSEQCKIDLGKRRLMNIRIVLQKWTEDWKKERQQLKRTKQASWKKQKQQDMTCTTREKKQAVGDMNHIFLIHVIAQLTTDDGGHLFAGLTAFLSVLEFLPIRLYWITTDVRKNFNIILSSCYLFTYSNTHSRTLKPDDDAMQFQRSLYPAILPSKSNS